MAATYSIAVIGDWGAEMLMYEEKAEKKVSRDS